MLMKVSESKVYPESVHMNYDKLHCMACSYRYARLVVVRPVCLDS